MRRHDGGSGYQWLAAYVLNVTPQHRPVDPARWTRLNAYVLDVERGGEKVAWERVTNCQSDDPGWAVKEILATQARNKRSRADRAYHLVVSFPDGEQPSRTQLEDIEDRLCAALGLEAHQRISAVHQNTDNWHVHVAINKIHPRTFHNPGTHLDRLRASAACADLEIRHGLRRARHTTALRQCGDRSTIGGRAADFEVWEGQPSFLRWVRENAAPSLLAARDGGRGWSGLHEVATRFDLEVRPYRTGLVICHRSVARWHLKASGVHGGLSLGAMTGALGPFQPPDPATSIPPIMSYAVPVRSGPLHDAFQQARVVAAERRASALALLRAQHADAARQSAAGHRDRVRALRRTGVNGPSMQDALRRIAEERRRDRAEAVARATYERALLREQHAIPTWRGYLETEASNGSEAALAALRDRMLHPAQAEGERLHAGDAGDCRHVIEVHLRPRVRQDGRVIYRTADGGAVWDEARSIRVSDITAGALHLALSLATARFGQRPLTVEGTEAFRAQVATCAGSDGFNVRFADASLERQRVSAGRARETSVERAGGGPVASTGHASAAQASALAAWRERGR